MTAEIAIANKSAVALAADSKVTIGGARNAKTYDTVNKVFTLSKKHPIGIMIFGNAEFMNYPWETIIKMYRRERGSAAKNYVEDWSDDFKHYISQFGKQIDLHREENIRSIIVQWLYALEDRTRASCMSDGIPIFSAAYDNVLLTTIQAHISRIGVHDDFLSKQKAKTILKNYGKVIIDAVSEVFSIDQTSELFKAALSFALLALVKDVDSPQSSGFVIAGFGEKEYFPTVIEHNTDGFIGKNLKVRTEPKRDISRSMPAYIGAFAQKDMAQIFMSGFDPALMQQVAGSFSGILEDSCLQVLDAYGLKSKKTDKIREEIKKACTDRVTVLLTDFMSQSRELFSDPVIQMVGLLPKDEIAHLAESLVALTSLRRRVSRDAETVGGPVDVALISKGDGFVWIKRKHYFRAEINPQFDRNYMADVR